MTIGITKDYADSKTAFLFPGQGAQKVGMGLELFKASSAAKDVFLQADEALGRKLSKVIFEGPEEELKQTLNTQPGIATTSIACMKAMEELLGNENMPNANLMAGHSLGEYTALSAAGVLDVGDTIKLVLKRGELMQQACEENPGTMAAIIGLDESSLTEIVFQTGAYISNINMPDQIVISGENMSIARAIDLAKARGAKRAIPLKVGGAFHSGLMEPAKIGLIETIADLDFHDPIVPIIANCSAEPLIDGENIKQELISQISSCVQWSKTMDYMIGEGVTNFIEIGPGRALSGMMKRFGPDIKTVSINDPNSIQELTS